MSISALDGTTATPKDSVMGINATNGQVGIIESSPISTGGTSTATHANDTEISSSTESVSETTPGEQDVPKELKSTALGVSAELQNGNTELLTEVAAQSITAEPGTVFEDVVMEQVEVVSKMATEELFKDSDVADQSVEVVTTELIKAAKDATKEDGAVKEDAATKSEAAVQPVTSAQDAIPVPGTAVVDVSIKHEEPVTEVATQATTTEPVTAAWNASEELMLASEDVTGVSVRGDLSITVDHKAAEQGVTSVLEVVAESGNRETVADVEDVTTETAIQGVHAEEPSPAICDISASPVVVQQEHTKELVATENDRTITKHNAQEIATDPCLEVQSQTTVKGVTTEPAASVQNMTMKPDAAVEDMPEEEVAIGIGQLATSSATAQCEVPDHLTTSADSTVEPQSVTTSNEPPTAQEETLEPVTLPQDTSSESDIAQSVTSVVALEVQDITVHNVLLDDQSVSKEPMTASPNITNPTEMVQCVESVTTEQEVTTKCIPAAENVSMDTTTADQSVAFQPTATAGCTDPIELTAEHIPMELDAESEKNATETVQNVVMESQNESKGVVQDVNMEPITEIQYPTEDLKAETQDSGLKAEVTDQVMVPSENGSCESKILSLDGIDEAVPVDEVSTVQSMTSTKEATGDVNNSTEAEVKHTSVQDDLDQSYAIAQDGSDPSKAAAQAVDEDGTEPNKGVLSFYSTPAQEAVFSEIQNAKFFSIICEQQIEIEGHTYIPVGICYLEKRKTPCEDVLAYVPLDQDIDAFVNSMATALSEKWGLNLAFCRGQSLLTIGAAGAQVRAAASLLSQRYPYAVRTFSSSVSLNTWLAKSCIISEIADSYTWVERMLQWVTEDEGKRAVLHKMVASLFQHDAVKHSDLTDRLSRSQWERSHDTLDLTVEVLEAIMLSLNDIKENHEIQSESTQAGDFLIILQNFEFILTLVIMKNVLGPTKSLSQSLQGQPLDVYQAVKSLSEVFSTLSDMKTNIDAHLQSWYQEAVAFASKLQISVDHTSQECLIIYCRDIISKGAIDHSICEITDLFSDCALSAVRCLQVVPYVISKTEGCCTDSDSFKVYQDDFPESQNVQAELLKWREKWLHTDPDQHPLPAGLLDTLSATDAESFPNIETLLRLLMVLPCFRREDLIRQGKKSLVEFNQQRSLLELYPL